MRLVGEVMRNEAKRWARQNISNHITSEFDLIAVQIIYSGLSHLGLQKEAESILLQRNKHRRTEELDVNWLQEQMPKLKAEDESLGIVLKNVIKRSNNDERKLNQWFKDSIQNNTSSSENPWIIFST
jgi:predicted transcriptional regulator